MFRGHNNAPHGLVLPSYGRTPPVNVGIRHALQRVAHCFGMGDMGQPLVNARNGQTVGILHQGTADVGGVGLFHVSMPNSVANILGGAASGGTTSSQHSRKSASGPAP